MLREVQAPPAFAVWGFAVFRVQKMLSRVQGNSMIEKECAVEVRESALKAISELSRLLEVCRDRCTDGDYERLKKGIGLSIGRIQTDLLDVVYSAYPDLDDLK